MTIGATQFGHHRCKKINSSEKVFLHPENCLQKQKTAPRIKKGRPNNRWAALIVFE
jgi:hypothetical protein